MDKDCLLQLKIVNRKPRQFKICLKIPNFKKLDNFNTMMKKSNLLKNILIKLIGNNFL
jgi:hypothetical protein